MSGAPREWNFPATLRPIGVERVSTLVTNAATEGTVRPPASRNHDWASGYVSASGAFRPPVHAGVTAGIGNMVSFLALSEVHALNAFRRVRAGKPLNDVAHDFGLKLADVLYVNRAAA